MFSDRSPHGSNDRLVPSRRRFLQAAGAATIVGLAGCNKDTNDANQGNGNNTGGSSASSQAVDSELTLDSLGIPGTDLQWNSFNFAGYPFLIQAHVFDPLGVHDPVNEKWVPLLLDEWSIDLDKNVMTAKLNQNYHWHNGKKVVKPVTAKDVYRHFQMEQYMGWSSSEYFKDVVATGKYSVKFNIFEGYGNEQYILWNTMLNVLGHGMPVYDKWLKRFEKASTQKDKEKVIKNLSQWKISSEDILTYGPFAIKSATTRELKGVKNSGHPAAKEINFPRAHWRYIGGGDQKLWQALGSDTLDGIARLNIPPDVSASFPEHVEYTLYPSLGGLAVTFNWGSKTFGDRRVREAIAQILDFEEITNAAGAHVRRPVEYNTGLAPGYNTKWVTDLDQFPKYKEANHEEATQLLKEADYTKKGSTWYRPNGKKFSPPLKTGLTGGAQLLAGETIATQLQRFGIDTQLQSMENTTFIDTVWQPGNFDFVVQNWGADYPQPYNWYNSALVENREILGLPKTVSTPPLGKSSGPANALDINLQKTVTKDLLKFNGKKLAKATTELAWLYSYSFPELQIYEKQNQSWFTDDDWVYPDLDSDIMQRKFYTPLHYILKTGKFKAKTK